MGRKKLDRFADNAQRYNVIEEGKDHFENLKGEWSATHFKNDHPLVVELGCGRGEYTVGLGERFSKTNFVGVDIKGARLWVGSSRALANAMHHVAFLRARIEQLDRHFAPGEINELWITFPDPRPKKRDEKRRLTSPAQLKTYKTLLKKEGWVKFKTDNTALFDYTLEQFEQGAIRVKDLAYTHDLYASAYIDEHFGVKTKYERRFHDQGERIKYMKFRFQSSPSSATTDGFVDSFENVLQGKS